MFKKVKLLFPFTRFERELLTELDIAPAQLHPNSWAFVRAYQIICAHLGHPASVDVFLYLFEAMNPGDRLWVSHNGVAGRSILSIFQQSYKDWKGKFVRVRCNDRDPSLLDGFPLFTRTRERRSRASGRSGNQKKWGSSTKIYATSGKELPLPT